MSQTHEIMLVRHPETAANVERRLCGRMDSPLTARGERQAVFLAEAIRSWDPDVLYTSPSERARTVALLADPDAARTVVLDDAREIDFGQAEGRTLDEVRESGIVFDYSGVGRVAPDGEEGAAFEARVARAAAAIIDGAERPVLVTHGGVLRFLLSHLLQIPTDLAWHIDLPNAVIAIVRSHDGYGVLSELRRSPE